MCLELIQQKEREKQFLNQLLHESKRIVYNIPIKLKGTLRSYQQEGVSWLAFLKKYNLHGILCDGTSISPFITEIVVVDDKE
jgi:TATA-binding protein-associated factor